jgi:NADH-quinone oxidoreductase subunit J
MVILLLVAAAAVASAVLVIMLDNPVHCALSLVVTLLCVAVMYAALNAPFVAIVQVAVYAGAIVVLFLFVIMLLNIRREEGGARASQPASLGGALFALVVLGAVGGGVATVPGTPRPLLDSYYFGSPQSIGYSLFSTYLLPFEVTSLLLTVGMVGAILLARRKL